MKIVHRKIYCCCCKKPIMAFVPEDTYDYLCNKCEDKKNG